MSIEKQQNIVRRDPEGRYALVNSEAKIWIVNFGNRLFKFGFETMLQWSIMLIEILKHILPEL